MNKKNLGVSYYLMCAMEIVVIPIVLIEVYDKFGGGLLRGFAGSGGGNDAPAVIDPDILLIFLNPALLIAGYALLVYFFRRYTAEKISKINKAIAILFLCIASVIMAVGVFWRAITT